MQHFDCLECKHKEPPCVCVKPTWELEPFSVNANVPRRKTQLRRVISGIPECLGSGKEEGETRYSRSVFSSHFLLPLDVSQK